MVQWLGLTLSLPRVWVQSLVGELISHKQCDAGKNEKKKKVGLIDKEKRLAVVGGWGWGQWGNVGQRVATFSYKMNKFWESNVQRGDYS